MNYISTQREHKELSPPGWAKIKKKKSLPQISSAYPNGSIWGNFRFYFFFLPLFKIFDDSQVTNPCAIKTCAKHASCLHPRLSERTPCSFESFCASMFCSYMRANRYQMRSVVKWEGRGSSLSLMPICSKSKNDHSLKGNCEQYGFVQTTALSARPCRAFL